MFEHFDDLGDPELLESKRKHEEKCKNLGLSSYLVFTTFTDWEEEKYGLEKSDSTYNGRTMMAFIYKTIKEKINNFVDLCSSVRAGNKGAKRRLAGEVINKFGKDALKTLLTATEKDEMDVFAALIKNSKKVS